MAYRKVYFRIKSGYSYDCGFQSDDAKEQFKEESQRIFQDAGWTLLPSRSSGSSDTVAKGEQELYLHPMSFSGVIDETETPVIEALLAQAATFQCYHTDIYEVFLDMDDDAYRTHLELQRNEIIAYILKGYKTKRRNLYAIISTVDIAKKFAVCRICDKAGHRNIANEFVAELVEQLLQNGQLVSAQTKNGQGIRAATDAEVKQRAVV